MESNTGFLSYLIPYWPFLTLFLGFMGGYMRMNYGIMNHRVFWWTSTLLFWFSIGVLIPDAWHPSLWWTGPAVTSLLAALVLFFHEIRYWLERMRKNMLRRVARRQKQKR